MFSHTHQVGKAGVEILSPAGTGKDDKHSSFQGSVSRAYERDIKGFTYCMDKASATTYIQCPGKGSRETLGVVQTLLVIQLQYFQDAKLSFEISIIDKKGQRRRLHISSVFRTMECNGLHAQIPWHWGEVSSDTWTNVVLDLPYLTQQCFQTAEYASLDGFCLRPMMKVRKIFTLPKDALVFSDVHIGDISVNIPSNLEFPKGTIHENNFFCELSIAHYHERIQMVKKMTIISKQQDNKQHQKAAGSHHKGNKSVAFGKSVTQPRKKIIDIPKTKPAIPALNSPEKGKNSNNKPPTGTSISNNTTSGKRSGNGDGDGVNANNKVAFIRQTEVIAKAKAKDKQEHTVPTVFDMNMSDSMDEFDAEEPNVLSVLPSNTTVQIKESKHTVDNDSDSDKPILPTALSALSFIRNKKKEKEAAQSANQANQDDGRGGLNTEYREGVFPTQHNDNEVAVSRQSQNVAESCSSVFMDMGREKVENLVSKLSVISRGLSAAEESFEAEFGNLSLALEEDM